MRKQIEMEDIENAVYVLRQAVEPTIQFSPDWEKTKDRAIVAMQQNIKQALACLERICSEANRER